MKTVILDEPGHISLIATEPPIAPGADKALVREMRAGIYGTDLHTFVGKQPFFSYPRILGHELAIEVVALGPSEHNHGPVVGDHCAVELYLNCGTCLSC